MHIVPPFFVSLTLQCRYAIVMILLLSNRGHHLFKAPGCTELADLGECE